MAPWLALTLKACLTALVLVAATFVAERSRPALAAAILALPLSAGPAYALLALQHDSEFLVGASLFGLMLSAPTSALVVAYGELARRGVSLVPALMSGFAAWCAALVVILAIPNRSLDWVVLTQLLAILVALTATRRWPRPPGAKAARRWYDLPLRVVLVVTCTVATVGLSTLIGPTATGVLAGLPIPYVCFIIIMHPRLGGIATAAIMADALLMLIGFASGLLAFHVAARAGQVLPGLILFFLVPSAYALAVLVMRARAGLSRG